MERHRAFQGVPHLHALCGKDRQQSIDISLTTPNLDAMGHRWVGVQASFEFALEYQKGADNGVADALSQVPIHHNRETVWSLMEGAIVGAVDQGEAKANEELLCILRMRHWCKW